MVNISPKKKVDLSKIKKRHHIGPWRAKDVPHIHKHIEKPTWAPWLAFSKKGMHEMRKIFSEGQLVVKNKKGLPLAYISTNRINWNGKIETLPTWDEVAGNQVGLATYGNTYQNQGNTLVIMCISVHPKHQGKYLPAVLVDEIKLLAQKLNIDHVISPFRPTNYGLHKQENKNAVFKEYCLMTRDDGLPVDAWLRNMVRNGMEPLMVRDNSLVVTVPRSEFEMYKKKYKKNLWNEIAPNVWECGEVGIWIVNEEKAIYQEPELWGKIKF